MTGAVAHLDAPSPEHASPVERSAQRPKRECERASRERRKRRSSRAFAPHTTRSLARLLLLPLHVDPLQWRALRSSAAPVASTAPRRLRPTTPRTSSVRPRRRERGREQRRFLFFRQPSGPVPLLTLVPHTRLRSIARTAHRRHQVSRFFSPRGRTAGPGERGRAARALLRRTGEAIAARAISQSHMRTHCCSAHPPFSPFSPLSLARSRRQCRRDPQRMLCALPGRRSFREGRRLKGEKGQATVSWCSPPPSKKPCQQGLRCGCAIAPLTHTFTPPRVLCAVDACATRRS